VETSPGKGRPTPSPGSLAPIPLDAVAVISAELAEITKTIIAREVTRLRA
jgi:hypothetical protein